jgi:hypothetical protein
MSFYKTSRAWKPRREDRDPDDDPNRPASFILEGNSLVRMQCQQRNGHWLDANVDLDQFLGNNNGVFDGSGTNFSHSARNVALQEVYHQGVGVGLVLHAELQDASGTNTWNLVSIDLSTVLENTDGVIHRALPSIGRTPLAEANETVSNDPWRLEQAHPFRGPVHLNSEVYPQNLNAQEEVQRTLRNSTLLPEGVRRVNIT